ncbi:hypothetical protein EG328_008991 [Venturia inaequalis]|uniref:Uncharacterized protein n=1 Tax=Venturia inaequalis TaxID=5025 RepID=A0A8H3UAH7_VENIN|nr:hypothetical protein EG328_008991 [Venturia inaequalis]
MKNGGKFNNPQLGPVQAIAYRGLIKFSDRKYATSTNLFAGPKRVEEHPKDIIDATKYRPNDTSLLLLDLAQNLQSAGHWLSIYRPYEAGHHADDASFKRIQGYA